MVSKCGKQTEYRTPTQFYPIKTDTLLIELLDYFSITAYSDSIYTLDQGLSGRISGHCS